MTNGIPCLEEPCTEEYAVNYAKDMVVKIRNLFPFDENLLKQEACLDEARKANPGEEIPKEIVNQCKIDFPVNEEELYKSTYIWNILLNIGTPWLKSVTDEFEKISSEHAGETFKLSNNCT